jgi:hypothetical protein
MPVDPQPDAERSDLIATNPVSDPRAKMASIGGTRPPASSWWRVSSIVLAILLVVVIVVPVILRTESASIQTRVEWFHYEVAGGPGAQNATLGLRNYTTIPPNTFCAPSNDLSVGLFSMTWTASNGTRVAEVRIWTPDPNLPFPNLLFLYRGYNESSGGTSFESPYPIPCGNMWVLDDDSGVPVTITAVMTLTYNYTATVQGYPFP